MTVRLRRPECGQEITLLVSAEAWCTRCNGRPEMTETFPEEWEDE